MVCFVDHTPSNFLKAILRKFYFFHSWILWSIYNYYFKDQNWLKCNSKFRKNIKADDRKLINKLGPVNYNLKTIS